MKGNTSIKLKAAFLVIVFGLNTVIGFACAAGVDMGFNRKHHHGEEAAKGQVHVHADGKKHQHPDESPQLPDSNKDSEKGGCCNDKVINFQSLDKAITQSSGIISKTSVFSGIAYVFLRIATFNFTQDSPKKFILNFFHPPPPEIRILIQSFQI